MRRKVEQLRTDRPNRGLSGNPRFVRVVCAWSTLYINMVLERRPCDLGMKGMKSEMQDEGAMLLFDFWPGRHR